MKLDDALRAFGDATAAAVKEQYPGVTPQVAFEAPRRPSLATSPPTSPFRWPKSRGGHRTTSLRCSPRRFCARPRSLPKSLRRSYLLRDLSTCASLRKSGMPSYPAFYARTKASGKCRRTARACRSSSAARIQRDRSSSFKGARCRSARRLPTQCAFAATKFSSNGLSTMPAANSTRSAVRSTLATVKRSNPRFPFPRTAIRASI